MPVRPVTVCDASKLIYRIDKQDKRYIKNAVACMEWVLSQNEIDREILSQAYFFICSYLETRSQLNNDRDLFKELVDRIDTRIHVEKGALDANKLNLMIKFSQLLILLHYRYPDLDNSGVVIQLLNTFQSNLKQTTEAYLTITGAADFLHRFRFLFRLHRNFGENLASVDSFFYQFKAIQQRLVPSNHTQFDFSNNVILDLYAFLDCFLDECSPLKKVTSARSVDTFRLSSLIKQEVFSLVKREKEKYFLRFLLKKWNYNKEESSAECKRNPQFCHQVIKTDVLPYKVSLLISEEFIPTIYFSERLNNAFNALLAESYQAVKKVYEPIFGADVFSKKNFRPEIYIFPNKRIYEQYGYELFGFQTNNGGQTFISGLNKTHSCRLAIYQKNKESLTEAHQYFNLPHELAHCYEGAASLQSYFGEMDSLPDSIRESVPQYIQIGVLKNSDICENNKLFQHGGLTYEVVEYARETTLEKRKVLLSDILNQPAGSLENYREATLLAAYLVEKNQLKEVMTCTNGKDEIAKSYPCYVAFIKQHNKDFLAFLNQEVIPTMVPSALQTSDLLEAIRTQDQSHLNCLLTEKYKSVNINQIRFSNKNTPLHEAIDSWLRLKNKKTGEKALTLIWLLFLRGAKLQGSVNANHQFPYDLVDDEKDRILLRQFEQDAKPKSTTPVRFFVETSTSAKTTFLAVKKMTTNKRTTPPLLIGSSTVSAIEDPVSTALVLATNESKKIKQISKNTSINGKDESRKHTAISTKVISIPLAERLLIAASLGVGDGLVRAIFQLIQREKPRWKEKRIIRFLLTSSQVFITASLHSFYPFFLSYPTRIGISGEVEPWFATSFYFATSVGWEFMMLCLIESLNADNSILRRFLPGCAYLSDTGLNRLKNILAYFFIFYPWLIVSFTEGLTENEWRDKLCSLAVNTLSSLIAYIGTQAIYLRFRHSHRSRNPSVDFLENGYALLTRNGQDKAIMPIKAGLKLLENALKPIRRAERYNDFFGDLYRNIAFCLENTDERSLEATSETWLDLSDLPIRYQLMTLYLEKMERNLFYLYGLSDDKRKDILFYIAALRQKINNQSLLEDKTVESKEQVETDVDKYFLTSDMLTYLRQTFLALSTLVHVYNLTLEKKIDFPPFSFSPLGKIFTVLGYLQKNLFDDTFYGMFCNKRFTNTSGTEADILKLAGMLNQLKQWLEELRGAFIALHEPSVREKAWQYLIDMLAKLDRIIYKLDVQKQFFRGNRTGEVARCSPLSQASFDALQLHLQSCEQALAWENAKVKVSLFTFNQLEKIKANLLNEEIKEFCDQSFSREEIKQKTILLQTLFYELSFTKIPSLQNRIEKFADIKARTQGICSLSSIDKILKFSLSTLGGAVSFQRGYQKGIAGEKVDRPTSRCHLSQLFKANQAVQMTSIREEASPASSFSRSE